MRQLDLIPRHLSIIRSEDVEITAKFADSLKKDGKYECVVNQVYKINWSIRNSGPASCKFIFRVCPVQETNAGIIFHNATEMIILGVSTQVLPELKPNESHNLETSFIFQKPGFVKIMSHVQKWKENESSIEGGAELDICWFQSGISAVVFE